MPSKVWQSRRCEATHIRTSPSADIQSRPSARNHRKFIADGATRRGKVLRMETPEASPRLTTKVPLGRRDRKAGTYHAEIHRLRTDGCTFEAIRLALQDAGVVVSVTTVKREARRPLDAKLRRSVDVQGAASARGQQPSARPARRALPALVEPDVDASHGFAGDARSGKQIVEEFMRDRIANSLLLERMHHENRRD